MRQPERMLYLGVPEDIYQEFQEEPIVKGVFEDENINIILYNGIEKTIKKWIKP